MQQMMRQRLLRSFVLTVFAAGLSCPTFAAAIDERTTPTSATFEKQAIENDRDDSPYVIGSQNLLQVKIFGEANVNQLYRVDEDGYIKHALAGRVKVGGLTVAEAEKDLEQRLDGDYIINPQVTVFVLEYSHFSIIGEVRKPGNYELSGKVSVIKAISIAGGFTPIANQKGVQIIRKNSGGTEAKITVDTTRVTQFGDLSAEEDLQAEDVVVVPKSFF